jgi:formate hydrogenlyase subunit 4
MTFLSGIGTGVAAVVQFTAVVMVAPLIQGVIKTVKARAQRRLGAPIGQPYADLAKYFSKTEVVSEQSSWITTLTPYLVFGCMGAATFFLPLAGAAPLGGAADLIVLLALFALARVFIVLAGLDAGGAFGGMGSSREMMVAVVAEPALLLVVGSVALRAGTTNLSQIVSRFASQGLALLTPSHLLAAFACGLLVITETGRLPVDNPDTHLELTMIHEGMLLEYSGRSLALLLWATFIKQVVIISLFVSLFLPWGIPLTGDLPAVVLGLLLFLGKVLIVAVVLGGIEMLVPKSRLFRLPRFLLTAFLAAFLAILSQYIMR